jgi:integrase/recombinase XerD
MRPFLQTKVLPDGLTLDLRSLTAADVISFVVTSCRRLNPGMAGLTVTALRSLLGFLYVDGAIDRSRHGNGSAPVEGADHGRGHGRGFARA